MEGVKFLIRDFENTNNVRLIELRRHVNSFIHGQEKILCYFQKNLLTIKTVWSIQIFKIKRFLLEI